MPACHPCFAGLALPAVLSLAPSAHAAAMDFLANGSHAADGIIVRLRAPAVALQSLQRPHPSAAAHRRLALAAVERSPRPPVQLPCGAAAVCGGPRQRPSGVSPCRPEQPGRTPGAMTSATVNRTSHQQAPFPSHFCAAARWRRQRLGCFRTRRDTLPHHVFAGWLLVTDLAFAIFFRKEHDFRALLR